MRGWQVLAHGHQRDGRETVGSSAPADSVGLLRSRSVGLPAFAFGKSFSPLPKWLECLFAKPFPSENPSPWLPATSNRAGTALSSAFGPNELDGALIEILRHLERLAVHIETVVTETDVCVLLASNETCSEGVVTFAVRLRFKADSRDERPQRGRLADSDCSLWLDGGKYNLCGRHKPQVRLLGSHNGGAGQQQND